MPSCGGAETQTPALEPGVSDEFQSGPGVLSLVRVTEIKQGNGPFNKLKINYENISQFPVTWQ